MTQSPEQPTGLDAQLDRLLQSPATPETVDSGDLPRLAALLAAAAAPSEAGPQPGEETVLAVFREVVTESAGVSSLAARRHRRRTAVVAVASTVAMLSGGVAAAATGALPGAAQTTAKTVLGALGVHVPGPDAHAGTHPSERGQSANHPTPTATQTPDSTGAPGALPTQAVRPSTPADGATPHGQTQTPGNSGPSRHHGNPTPTASGHPAPGHGKPTAKPVVPNRGQSAQHRHTPPHHAVMRVAHPSMTR